MALTGAATIGRLIRMGKDGNEALRALTQSYSTVFTASDAPDLKTIRYQMAGWKSDLDGSEVKEQALLSQWLQWGEANYGTIGGIIDSWRLQAESAITGRVYELLDDPTLTETTTDEPSVTLRILGHLGRRMVEESESVLACNVSVASPVNNSSNTGTPLLTFSLSRKGFEPDNTLIDNEAVFPSALTVRYYNDSAMSVGIDVTDPFLLARGYSPGVKTVDVVSDSDNESQATAQGIGVNIFTESGFTGDEGTLLASGSGGLSCTSSAVKPSTTFAHIGDYSLKIPAATTASGGFQLGSSDDISSWGNTNSELIGAGTIEADTIYSFTLWHKAISMTSGSLTWKLKTPTASVALCAVTGSAPTWTSQSTIFRTPADWNTENCKLMFVAAASNADIYVDSARLFKPDTHGGVICAFSAGATDIVPGDVWEGGSISNNECGKMQRWIRDAYGTMLPSSSSPSSNFIDGGLSEGGSGVLGEVAGINLKDDGSTDYTIVLGHLSTAYVRVNTITVICTAADTLTGDANMKIGHTRGGEEIMAEATLTGLDDIGETFTYIVSGLNINATPGNDTIYVQISSADSGTSGTATVVLEGVVT